MIQLLILLTLALPLGLVTLSLILLMMTEKQFFDVPIPDSTEEED
jgi:hypothetical protein